jgi:hypothetical protein
MWQALVQNVLKGVMAAKSMGGESSTGSDTSQLDNMNNSISNMMKKQDQGFYGHMTVGKARKTTKVKVIGRGD